MKEDQKDNLEAIQSILSKMEKLPILEPWAFYLWGIVITAGGIIHFFLAKNTLMNPVQFILFLWFPITFLGIIIETLAMIITSKKYKFNLFSHRIKKLFLLYFFTMILFLYLLYIMVEVRGIAYIPSVLLLLFSVMLCVFGIHISEAFLPGSYYFLFFFIVSIIVKNYTHHIPVGITPLLTSIIFGIGVLFCGIFYQKELFNKNDNTKSNEDE